MPKRPSRSTGGPNASQNAAPNANPKGERLNSKQAKVTAHRGAERRTSSKGRG